MSEIDGIMMTGDRITLRPMSEEDSKLIVEWRNDPEISRWFFSSEPATLQSHSQWFRRPKPNRLDYVICLSESSIPIGTVNYANIDARNAKAEAGKMLGDRTQWGKGLAKEAFRVWLNYGFQTLGFKHVYIRTFGTNQTNIKLNERLGFRIEGVEHNGYWRGDETYDIVTMGLDRKHAIEIGL